MEQEKITQNMIAPIEPNVKSKQVKARIWATVQLLTVLFAGFFVGRYLFPATEQSSDCNCATNETKTESEANIQDKEKQDEEKRYLSVVDSSVRNEIPSEQIQEVTDLLSETRTDVSNSYKKDFIDGYGMPVLLDGLHSYISSYYALEDIYSYDEGDESAKEQLFQSIEQSLINNGFAKIDGAAPLRLWILFDEKQEVYHSGNMQCFVHGSGDLSKPYVYIDCTETSWTSLDEAKLELIEELEQAYFEKEGDYPGMISENYSIEDSDYEPYQRLDTTIDNFMGRFYRSSSESPWKYFVGTQGMLECSDYNTNDLKKAYLGEACYDSKTGTDLTVSL